MVSTDGNTDDGGFGSIFGPYINDEGFVSQFPARSLDTSMPDSTDDLSQLPKPCLDQDFAKHELNNMDYTAAEVGPQTMNLDDPNSTSNDNVPALTSGENDEDAIIGSVLSDNIRSLLNQDNSLTGKVNPAWFRSSSHQATPDCSAPDTDVTIKKEPLDCQIMSERFGEVVELSDDEDETLKAVLSRPDGPNGPNGPNIPIKTEPTSFESKSKRFNPGEVIDISDNDDDRSKGLANINKSGKNYKLENSTKNNIFSTAGNGKNEEIIVFDDGSTSVNIKQENPKVESLEPQKEFVDLSDLESEPRQVAAPSPKFGSSFMTKSSSMHRKPQASLEQMKKLQRMYADRALRRALPTREGKNFRPSQPRTTPSSINRPVITSNIPNDRSASLTEDPAIFFLRLKLEYKAKRKSQTNTIEDDFNFKRAQIEETNRLRNLTDSESSQAEESDDGLFVPQDGPLLSTKPYFTLVDNDNGEGGDKEEAISSGKLQNENLVRRARAKAHQNELLANMTAGIENIILKDRYKMVEAAIHNGKKRSHKKTFDGYANMATKRTKTGRISNIGSLMTGSFIEDSNANLDRDSLPVVTEKKKKDFISSLTANVPSEGQKQANQDRIDLDRATKILGKRKVKPDGKGNWAFKGMRSSLYHYQVMGASSMRLRETGEQHPYGGILADEMGLGKTVQMIAAMIANPQMEPGHPRCTLIVCSPALIDQWYEELKKHAEEKVLPRIVRHRGGNKISDQGAENDIEKYTDVVITTYGEVVRSYPRCAIPKEYKSVTEQETWWKQEWEEKRGLLHRVEFHRVALDEAQVIKNHASRTSIACRALMARHRWAISGTPIQNKLEELFPYFKFLRVNHTGSIDIFRHNFCRKDSDECNKRLHSMLVGMIIRRTHADTLLGAPLLKLPKITQKNLKLRFNGVEREIYDHIRHRCIKAINVMVRKGRPDEVRRMVLIMLQRLRQMTSHIFMVQEALQRKKSISFIRMMWGSLNLELIDHNDPEQLLVLGLMEMVREKQADPKATGTRSDFINQEESTRRRAKKQSSSDLKSTFGQLLAHLEKEKKWDQHREHTLCSLCGDSPDDPIVISCKHLFCRDCLVKLGNDAAERGLDQTPCIRCGTVFTDSQSCKGMKRLEIPDISASVYQQKENANQPKDKFVLEMNHVDPKGGKLRLSTKTAAVKSLLQDWLSKNPATKIIVFSEWHMTMHVLGRVCQEAGWKNAHYNGKMSQRARDQSLSAFRDPSSGVRVLIASLKCGGTGLNLTVASRVICVDLWWNSSVEQQAFARVHRIGQTEETYITRCVIKGSVDDKLMKMQEEKSHIINGVMNDRSVMQKMTLEELLQLFGTVGHDKQNNPFILVDDELEAPSSEENSEP